MMQVARGTETTVMRLALDLVPLLRTAGYADADILVGDEILIDLPSSQPPSRVHLRVSGRDADAVIATLVCEGETYLDGHALRPGGRVRGRAMVVDGPVRNSTIHAMVDLVTDVVRPNDIERDLAGLVERIGIRMGTVMSSRIHVDRLPGVIVLRPENVDATTPTVWFAYDRDRPAATLATIVMGNQSYVDGRSVGSQDGQVSPPFQLRNIRLDGEALWKRIEELLPLDPSAPEPVLEGDPAPSDDERIERAVKHLVGRAPNVPAARTGIVDDVIDRYPELAERLAGRIEREPTP